jgi:two-component system, LuxR family, response regulator FixJ
MPPDPIVFVVDDDPAMRKSLRWLIESVGLAVAAFERADTFLLAYDGTQPGCLVLDVRMPGMSGLELQAALAARSLQIPTIVITGHADVTMAVRAVQNGALDFLEKPFSDQVLLDRIRQAIEIDRLERVRRDRQHRIAERMARLTSREQEVMRLVVQGKSNKEVAGALALSPKTVEVHRAHVMEKMEVDSLAELIRAVLVLEPR